MTVFKPFDLSYLTYRFWQLLQFIIVNTALIVSLNHSNQRADPPPPLIQDFAHWVQFIHCTAILVKRAENVLGLRGELSKA